MKFFHSALILIFLAFACLALPACGHKAPPQPPKELAQP